MKDEWRLFLAEAAGHPLAYGLVAAIARWRLGDRGGGLQVLITYVTSSMFVAWAAAMYFAGEQMVAGRKNLYLLLLSFVAKDLLMALVGLGAQFAANPIDLINRVRGALGGGGARPS